MAPAKRLRRNLTSKYSKCLHCAVDFANTFSAAAYAVTSAPLRPSGPETDHWKPALHNIKVVTDYPDAEDYGGRNVFETPTELLYQDLDESNCFWGWEARTVMKEQKDAHRWRSNYARLFKLLLSDSDNSKDIREELHRKILQSKKTTVDVIVDFLKPFRDHIIDHIKRREDHDGSFGSWDQYWTFTVPAAWTPPARRQMKEAIELAGFQGKTIKLISEPEAAALYVLEVKEDLHQDLHLGKAYIIADLGGGTMDFATFEVDQTNPLILKRLAGVSGCTIGSENLNQRFGKLVDERLHHAFDYLERKSGDTRETIKERAKVWFESKKRGFKGRASRSSNCPVSHLAEDEEKRFGHGRLEVSSDEIADIFDEIIKEICSFIVKQINTTYSDRKREFTPEGFRIQNIFLTGGLAANTYVHDCVKSYFADERIFGYPIVVSCPSEPEKAVVRGAVWRSMNPETISSRTSETSYGFPRDEFDTGDWAYGGPEPERNPVTGTLERRDRMQWVIKKNTQLKNGQRVPYPLERYIPLGRSLQFSECLFYSDTMTTDYTHYEHPEIHQIGPLEFNLERWRDRFKVEKNVEGLEYMVVRYNLVSIVSDDDWEYEIEVFNERTKFRGSTDIAAAFKLSQGRSSLTANNV